MEQIQTHHSKFFHIFLKFLEETGRRSRGCLSNTFNFHQISRQQVYRLEKEFMAKAASPPFSAEMTPWAASVIAFLPKTPHGWPASTWRWADLYGGHKSGWVRPERTKRLRKDEMNKGKSCRREAETKLDLNRNKCALITGRLTWRQTFSFPDQRR